MLEIIDYKERKPSIELDGVYCFSTSRHGGVGVGNYASMNCTPYTDDNPEAVNANLHILDRKLPISPSSWVIPHQVHGDSIAVINRDTQFSEERGLMVARPEGVDAVITDDPGVCLCVSTADCIPILLYDSYTHAIAAVHAGWRGTVSGILSKTIERMSSVYGTQASDIFACICPGISLDAFEVGDEVYEAFKNVGFDMSLIAEHRDKWHIDLKGANRLLLLQAGVMPGHIEVSDICTFSNSDDFFSARKLGVRSGRILSGILLKR